MAGRVTGFFIAPQPPTPLSFPIQRRRHGFFLQPSSASSSPPVVQNIVPTTGSTINQITTVSFDVTSPTNTLKRVIVWATYPVLGTEEVIFDGFVFGLQYSNLSVRTSITNGFHYVAVRNGGWPSQFTITADAFDTTGGED